MFNLDQLPDKEKEAIQYLVSQNYDLDISLDPTYKPQKIGERYPTIETEYIDKTVTLAKQYRIITGESKNG